MSATRAQLDAALEHIRAVYTPRPIVGPAIPTPAGGSLWNLAVHGDYFGAPFLAAFTAGDELVGGDA
jgi:hypothetical protein